MVAFGILVWYSPEVARLLGLDESLSEFLQLIVLGLGLLWLWPLNKCRPPRGR